jgi:predicted DCC family thiol-disulfide oxidoreductase YuxK
MPIAPQFPLQIFYDGSCSVCAREIETYRSADHQGRLVCIDISAPGFDPQMYGIPLKELMYELHAIDQRGTVYRGVEAFWAIWQAFPSSTLFRLLGKAIQLPLINSLARICYKGFARIRPYLPQRDKACESGTCRIGRKRSD